MAITQRLLRKSPSLGKSGFLPDGHTEAHATTVTHAQGILHCLDPASFSQLLRSVTNYVPVLEKKWQHLQSVDDGEGVEYADSE